MDFITEAGYKRVRLENIGPFDNLELELDERWNILLGDHGVGKSTIIRAIAVGICGRDSYADRLIKIGKTRGSITLETKNGNKYVTELLRTEGEAEVRLTPMRPPLETEGWLTMGFPPLRTVTWERPRGPQLEKGSSVPTSDDLLPLIKNEPEPYLDEVKQWIINLDYWGIRDKRYAKLLQEFFLIIDQLTGDVTVKFKDVKPGTNQIKVITDDGELSIEAVSQGTVSLIGWTGALLQRMYEVYSQEDEPRKQYALVLIDEIDAHMHPGWQQSLVPNLTELFPNVQFIAATYSPLVVAELERNQVFVLNRDFETRQVDVAQADEDFTWFRADQMLTSSLFGLTRSRGSRTVSEFEKYDELLRKKVRTPEEERELEELGNYLEGRLMSSDTPARRRIEEAIRSTLTQMSFARKLNPTRPAIAQKVKPAIYAGPLGWGWCELGEVADIVQYKPKKLWGEFHLFGLDNEAIKYGYDLAWSPDLVEIIQDGTNPVHHELDFRTIYVPAGWSLDVIKILRKDKLLEEAGILEKLRPHYQGGRSLAIVLREKCECQASNCPCADGQREHFTITVSVTGQVAAGCCWGLIIIPTTLDESEREALTKFREDLIAEGVSEQYE